MSLIKRKSARLLQLHCRWHDCDTPSFSVSISDYASYANHLRMHVDSSINVANAVYARMKPQGEGSQLIFKCEWEGCNIELFSDPAHFTRHLMYHGYHSKLKDVGRQEQERSNFSVCRLNEETRDYLPDLSDPFICYWRGCGVEFQCPIEYFGHVDDHAVRTEISLVDEPEEYFNCYVCQWNDCNCTFKTVYKLKEHCRVHTHERLIACPVCGGFFSNRTKFIDHLSRQDSESYENFQCSHCLRRCASERLLRDHMRHHVNHLKCPQCDMTCPNPSSLRDHFRFRHSEDRPYVCEICNFRCKSASDLQRHEETHLGNKYCCPVEGCNFVTKTLPYLKSHHRNKHENTVAKKFICHICEARYTRGTGLTTHLKAKHNFRWPSGHPRFRYKEYEDGLFRLQMVRFESAELTEKLAQGDLLEEECIEMVDLQDQDNDQNGKFCHILPETDFSGNDENAADVAESQNESGMLALKSIQETLSQARHILANMGDKQVSTLCNSMTSSNTFTNTRSTFNTGSIDETTEFIPNHEVSQRSSQFISDGLTIQPDFLLPPRPVEGEQVSNSDLDTANSVSRNLLSATSGITPLTDKTGGGNCKRKGRTRSARKTKKSRKGFGKEDYVVKIADSIVTDECSDYDQRLDISHTLLSLHSTGLVRL